MLQMFDCSWCNYTALVKPVFESEKDMSIETTVDDWQDMYKVHHACTSSWIQSEFSWRNFFFYLSIAQKTKGKLLNRQRNWWSGCGLLNVHHQSVFRTKICGFEEMVSKGLLEYSVTKFLGQGRYFVL